MTIRISTNFEAATARMNQTVATRLKEVTASALNNTAFEARTSVQNEMRRVFRNPEPITVNSVAVIKADGSKPVDEQSAMVWIRDDLPKASTQPAKYLLTQEKGGQRAAKRSERALSVHAILMGGQQLTPGPGAPLDAHGQLSGGGMTQVLSRIGALREAGSQGNATAATTQRLIRRARMKAAQASKRSGGSKDDIKVARGAAFLPIHKKSGTDFFLMKSKLTSGFAGVFQLVGRGKVRPVLWFTTKRPGYTARFPFRSIVAKAVSEKLPRQWVRALRFVASRD